MVRESIAPSNSEVSSSSVSEKQSGIVICLYVAYANFSLYRRLEKQIVYVGQASSIFATLFARTSNNLSGIRLYSH